MLEVNLAQGKPPLQVEFRLSLAGDLMYGMVLVVVAPRYEGFDQWVYGTRAALPPDLHADMEAVMALIHRAPAFAEWLYGHPPDHPLHHTLEGFTAGLAELPPDDLARFVREAVEDMARHHHLSPPPSPDDLEPFFTQALETGQAERLAALARDPAQLGPLLLSTITRFWDRFYRSEYERVLPMMERSIQHHRRQRYGPDFPALFTAVTGRLLPDGLFDPAEIERVILTPSAHVGPYFGFRTLQGPPRTLVLIYNCRPTGIPQGEPRPLQDLFPPLKALADETRLQILSILDGRELYAQQIVERLDISQPAVSRHLQLMVAGGVLRVRKEEGMKYFAVNEAVLASLADRLRRFRGPS